MSLTKLALKRPVSVILIILALAVFGLSSIPGFKMQLTPDMDMPMLIVMTTYPGADPESAVSYTHLDVYKRQTKIFTEVRRIPCFLFRQLSFPCLPYI